MSNCVSDHTEELRYKYAIVELFGAGCLPLFTTILQVCRELLSVSWSLWNRFRTGQDPFSTCWKKWVWQTMKCVTMVTSLFRN